MITDPQKVHAHVVKQLGVREFPSVVFEKGDKVKIDGGEVVKVVRATTPWQYKVEWSDGTDGYIDVDRLSPATPITIESKLEYVVELLGKTDKFYAACVNDLDAPKNTILVQHMNSEDFCEITKDISDALGNEVKVAVSRWYPPEDVYASKDCVVVRLTKHELAKLRKLRENS